MHEAARLIGDVMHSEQSKDMSESIVYRVDDQPTADAMAALRESVGWDGARSDFPAAYSGYLATVSTYTEDGELVGWASLVSDGVRHGFFVDVVVHAAYQRCGIGRELVSRAVKHGRSRGLCLFHADFSPENSDFYRSCGFHVGAGGYLEFQDDAGA